MKKKIKKTAAVKIPVAVKARAPKEDPKMKQYRSAFPAVDAAFTEWKSGTSLSDIVSTYKLPKRDTAYKPFLILAGGLEAFKALRTQGAGGRSFGGKGGHHAGRSRTVATRAQDDKNVRHVVSSPRWKMELVWEPVVVKIDTGDGEKKMSWRTVKAKVYVAPSGNRYVAASATEKADLIMRIKWKSLEHARARQDLAWAEADAARTGTKVMPKRRARLERVIAASDGDVGAWTVRLRRFESSAVARKLNKEDRLVARGLKAQAAKKKQQEQQERDLARRAREHKKEQRTATKTVKTKKQPKTVTRRTVKKKARR